MTGPAVFGIHEENAFVPDIAMLIQDFICALLLVRASFRRPRVIYRRPPARRKPQGRAPFVLCGPLWFKVDMREGSRTQVLPSRAGLRQGLPAYAVASFLVAHGFGEASPELEERSPDGS